MRLQEINIREWGDHLKEKFFSRSADKPSLSSPRWRGVLALLPAALLGFFCAFLMSLFFDGFLVERLFSAKEDLALAVGKRTPSVLNRMAQQKSGLLADQPNAFGVTERNPALNSNAGNSDAALSSMMLVGTIPNIAAWIRVGEETSFILKGQLIRGYTLELVDSGRILISKDGNNNPLYLSLSGAAPLPESVPTPIGDPANGKSAGAIQQAVPGGSEGVISRELINQLMTNPYSEMGKIRMVPDESGSGMKILRVAPDSLLGQLGMKEGDTLRGFNGISIVNMANLSNAIGSLMGGNRMDLQLKRNSEDVMLPYAVR